jgi:RNA:NAD 2'-phosphotransferase (TPT1/KptA family)
LPTDADSGGREENELENREWLLRCHGWRVYAADGAYVGVVVDVLYDYSTRWDRPRELRIRAGRGHAVDVAIERVATVDPPNATVRLGS